MIPCFPFHQEVCSMQAGGSYTYYIKARVALTTHAEATICGLHSVFYSTVLLAGGGGRGALAPLREATIHI